MLHRNFISQYQQISNHLLPILLIGVFVFFPISSSAANLIMVIAFFLWATSGNWPKKWTLLIGNPGLWFALGLYFWIWIGIAYTNASNDDIQLHLIKYFKLAFMAVIVTTLNDNNWRRRAWWGFGFSVAFTLISTYLNIWWDLPWSVTHNQGWNTDHTVAKDYISQGILVSMFTAICIGQVIRKNVTRKVKFLWILAAALSIISITHLSSGRSAYLSLAAVLITFSFWAASGWRRWLALLFVSLAIACGYVSSPNMQSRVAEAINEARNHHIDDFSSIGQRLYFAKKTMDLIEEKPIFGWGTGAYHDQFCLIADNDAWCRHGGFHPHNQFLFIWMEHGVVGLVLMLGMILSPLWITRNAPSHIRGIAAAYSGIFIVISMTHGSLWLSTESHFHTFMGALILAGYKIKIDNNEDKKLNTRGIEND